MGLGHYEKLEAGDVVNGLEILDYSHTDKWNNRWMIIKCYCGKEFATAAWRIKSGKTKSCGCLKVTTCVLRNISVPYAERVRRSKKQWETRRKSAKI